MSRKTARDTLSLEAYQEAMKGIYTTTATRETLDEAPMAYKRMEDIIDAIREAMNGPLLTNLNDQNSRSAVFSQSIFNIHA